MTFDVPFEDGGSAITKYVYRVENVDGSEVTSGDVKNFKTETGRLLATEVKTFEFTKDELSMLQSDTIYRFRVAAVNGEGTGAFSDFATLNFSGWHNPKDDDSGTTAVIIVVVIVILILVIGAIITYYFCTNQKKAQRQEDEKKKVEEEERTKAKYQVAAPDTERAETPRQRTNTVTVETKKETPQQDLEMQVPVK